MTVTNDVFKYVTTTEMNGILTGNQTCIAKINDGYWSSLNIGDTVSFIDGVTDKCIIKVCSINYTANFGDAWFLYNENLFPETNFTSRNEANIHFKKLYRDSDVATYGVIIINFVICK